MDDFGNTLSCYWHWSEQKRLGWTADFNWGAYLYFNVPFEWWVDKE